MPFLSHEDKQKIVDKLNRKVPNPICPMCHKGHFSIADSYFNNVLQDDLTSIALGGPSIPTIAIVCANCGYVAQHALGILGLLSGQPAEEVDDAG